MAQFLIKMAHFFSNSKNKFGKIYEKHIDKIYRFVFLKVNSQEVAEDITSEVFTKGWDAFKTNRAIKNVPAFLYQIARNLITDHYRQKGQAQFVSVENAPRLTDLGTGLEEQAMLKSDVNRVKAALANIKEDYREVIVWYYLDELKVPEIAKILNKSEEAVRVRIHRALNDLRDVIK